MSFRIATVRSGVRADEVPEPWSCFLDEASVRNARTPPSGLPTLYVTGGADEVAVTEVQREDFDELCDQGMRAQYMECAGMSHDDAARYALTDALRWLGHRVAGEPLAEACMRGEPVDCTEVVIP